jgi:hypothetical protein
MKRKANRIILLASMAVVLAFFAPACESPNGPRFPDPEEEKPPEKEQDAG